MSRKASVTSTRVATTTAGDYGSLRSQGRRIYRRHDPSMLPRSHIAEQKSRDLALLDFLAAFGDAVAAVMPVDVLERLVTRIAHAAMHLHGAVGGFAAQTVGPEITH